MVINEIVIFISWVSLGVKQVSVMKSIKNMLLCFKMLCKWLYVIAFKKLEVYIYLKNSEIMKGAMRRDKTMRQNDKTMSVIVKGKRRRYRDGGERLKDRLGEEKKKNETRQVEDKEEERKGDRNEGEGGQGEDRLEEETQNDET